jgi:mRNA interferase RelE/StbE
MYQVRFAPKGLEQMQQLNKPVAQQVLKKLRWMAENFEQSTRIPLVGNLKGIFKLRVGDYRVLYTFDEASQIIMIHFVQHRSEVYKDR